MRKRIFQFVGIFILIAFVAVTYKFEKAKTATSKLPEAVKKDLLQSIKNMDMDDATERSLRFFVDCVGYGDVDKAVLHSVEGSNSECMMKAQKNKLPGTSVYFAFATWLPVKKYSQSTVDLCFDAVGVGVTDETCQSMQFNAKK